MAETFVLSFVEKLTLLEKTAGSRVHYRVAPPISTPLCDAVSIQKVARQIAEFIGLSQFTFIITFSKQRTNVGGHIDLSTRGNEVFIEIDPEALAFADSVGATLCHEICHKWLQVMRISSPIEMDNEILTDITAVFLGFGKIMLNGCEVMKVTHERVADTTTTTTKTLTTGYLKRDQLAFVYRLVCAMRKIPSVEYMLNLNPAASAAIAVCDSSFGQYYNVKFHDSGISSASVASLQNESAMRQREMAELTTVLIGNVHNWA